MNGSGSHGFQFTPAGIIPLDQKAPDFGDEVAGGAAPRQRAPDPEPEAPAKSAEPTKIVPGQYQTFDPTKPLTGRELLAQAKARVKEIDRQLRSVPALQAERARLTALIEAAKAAVPRRSRKAH